MKKTIASLLVAASAGLAFIAPAQASDAGIPWDKFPTEKASDQAALQRGAKLFVNYCLNCHSAAFMRYNRLRDIGLTEEQIKANLMFATTKVGDTMVAAIDARQAKDWLGATPPDLTLVARSRAGAQGSGADYLYTYMRTFYRDETKATGWNNLVFPSVGMPHVLWELQGEQRLVHGEGDHAAPKLQLAKPGSMTPEQYDAAMGDLVAFLQWMGEPAQGLRTKLGYFVVGFLVLFAFVASRLNKAYWKDIK